MRWWLLVMLVGCTACSATPDATSLRAGGVEVAVLRCPEDHSPCLWPVRTPSGIEITRAFPFRDDVPGEQHDHPHHRGVWFAHGDVNGHDAWHGDLHIVTNDVQVRKGTIESRHNWMDEDGDVLLRDSRLWRAEAVGDTRFIDIEIMLEAVDEPVVFGDTKEGAMAIRLHPQLRVEGPVANGTLLTSAGVEGKPAWGTRARWCAAQGTINGAPVTVALIDHPENPNHPTWWHARAYGLLAANPFGRRAFEGISAEPMTVTIRPGSPLVLRYRLVVADGILAPARLEHVWAESSSGLPSRN